MERTLVLIKPDAVMRGLTGEIIRIYEMNGLKVVSLYSHNPSEALLEKHYAEHVGREFYSSLIAFMMSGTIIVMALEAEGAVDRVREINGATNPENARPCTIRYLYGTTVQQNAVHGSANIEDAKRELDIWFKK